MIRLTRLNQSPIVLNVENIQSLEATPDTLITLTNNSKMMVQEPVEEVSRKIFEYQRQMSLAVCP